MPCGPGYKYFLELEKMKKKENKLNMSFIKVTWGKFLVYAGSSVMAFIAAGRTVYDRCYAGAFNCNLFYR